MAIFTTTKGTTNGHYSSLLRSSPASKEVGPDVVDQDPVRVLGSPLLLRLGQQLLKQLPPELPIDETRVLEPIPPLVKRLTSASIQPEGPRVREASPDGFDIFEGSKCHLFLVRLDLGQLKSSAH